MATRCHFPSDVTTPPAPSTAPVVPVANGTWGVVVGGASPFRQLLNPSSKRFDVSGSAFGGSFTSGLTQLCVTYVSPPIMATTISGTVKMQCRVRELAADDQVFARLEIYVVSRDGGTVRGTLLSLGGYGSGTEYAVGSPATNRKMASGEALSSVVAQNGDRIVLCVGNGDVAGNTPGAFCNLNDVGSDVPEDETATSGAAWIEFSATLQFGWVGESAAGVGAASCTGRIVNMSFPAAGVGAASIAVKKVPSFEFPVGAAARSSAQSTTSSTKREARRVQ